MWSSKNLLVKCLSQEFFGGSLANCMKISAWIMLCLVMQREDLEAISKWGMHNALVIESSINWAITHTVFCKRRKGGSKAPFGSWPTS